MSHRGTLTCSNAVAFMNKAAENVTAHSSASVYGRCGGMAGREMILDGEDGQVIVEQAMLPACSASGMPRKSWQDAQAGCMLAAVLLECCISRMKPVGRCPVFCDWLGVSSSCRERELVRRVEKDWVSLLPSHKHKDTRWARCTKSQGGWGCPCMLRSIRQCSLPKA